MIVYDMPDEALREELLFGVRFRRAGQIFFFRSTIKDIRMGTDVLVETEQGLLLGKVEVLIVLPTNADNAIAEGRVLRLATAQDLAKDAENHLLVAEAVAFCKSCIREHHLDMKLVYVEVLHDRSKLIFYFTAPSRIDFRELVKDLVRTYRTRIELRQIGVRHEAQILGGLGNCGRVCCCRGYLRTFAPVTIKMAKEQNIFLNPAKLSGLCGRLLCCLSFEQSNYEEFNQRCPKLGKLYKTSVGTIKVLRANMFSRSVTGMLENHEEREYTLDEWDKLNPLRSDGQEQIEERKNDVIDIVVPFLVEDDADTKTIYQQSTSYKKRRST